jgi:hypothetical protein
MGTTKHTPTGVQLAPVVIPLLQLGISIVLRNRFVHLVLSVLRLFSMSKVDHVKSKAAQWALILAYCNTPNGGALTQHLQKNGLSPTFREITEDFLQEAVEMLSDWQSEKPDQTLISYVTSRLRVEGEDENTAVTREDIDTHPLVLLHRYLLDIAPTALDATKALVAFDEFSTTLTARIDVTRIAVGLFMNLAVKRSYDDAKLEEYRNGRVVTYISALPDIADNHDILSSTMGIVDFLHYHYNVDQLDSFYLGQTANLHIYYSNYLCYLRDSNDTDDGHKMTTVILSDLMFEKMTCIYLVMKFILPNVELKDLEEEIPDLAEEIENLVIGLHHTGGLEYSLGNQTAAARAFPLAGYHGHPGMIRLTWQKLAHLGEAGKRCGAAHYANISNIAPIADDARGQRRKRRLDAETVTKVVEIVARKDKRVGKADATAEIAVADDVMLTKILDRMQQEQDDENPHEAGDTGTIQLSGN